MRTMGSLLIAGILLLTQSLKGDTAIRAQETKSDSASLSPSDNARLVVNRAANFGILESVTVFVDGVQVAELELSQNYDAMLPPGQHLVSISMNPKMEGQKPTQRQVDAKPGKTYAFRAVWRSAGYASLEQ
jgi:archaellum component FlaG (FlaF/FlaG flagellin family)